MSIISTENDPLHLAIAASYLGQSETEAANKSPFIRSIWQRFGASWLLGQPWCGGFVALCLDAAKLPYVKNYFRALAWVDYGGACVLPHLGCIAILERKGGGHVAFVVGEIFISGVLHYVLLGGNQGDKVSLITVKATDIKCFRAVPDGQAKHHPTAYTAEWLKVANAGTGGQYV